MNQAEIEWLMREWAGDFIFAAETQRLTALAGEWEELMGQLEGA